MKPVALSAVAVFLAGGAHAQVPVIDSTNYAVARETAQTTNRILDTNQQVLETVNETLAAVTGDRGSDTEPMRNLVVGNGFNVASVPSFTDLLSGNSVDFGELNPQIASVATQFINGLELVRSISGNLDDPSPADQSYQELMRTVMSVAALVSGSNEAVEARQQSFEQAGSQIGQAEDIKGSIDQNTQLQVQAGLTINELIGVMNGAVQSLQADNQRVLTDISNTSRALNYDID